MLKLETSVQYLPGVGPKMAGKLKRLGIETVRDLLFYYPRTWQDFSRPVPIKSLRIGDNAIIKAEIMEIKISRTRRKWMSIIDAVLGDDTGQIKAIWFNQPFLMKVLKPNETWLFAGKVNWDFKGKQKTLTVTQYEKPTGTPLILSVYSETEGVTSKYLRKLIKPLFTTDTPDVSERLVKEYLPEEILKQEDLIGLSKAVQDIHFPQKNIDIETAKKRLGFDELFLIALRLLLNKKELSKSFAPALTFDENLLKDFVGSLPFKLTNAQRKAAWEIIKDLTRTMPMNRLLEGDVGSGKTVVAAMAALVTAKNNYQSVWLAPTEILANQHYKNVSKLFEKYYSSLSRTSVVNTSQLADARSKNKIKIGLLTSANKKANLAKDDLIIGTHALLQEKINIPKLALVIVDEQHRFGVKQRAHLRMGTVLLKGTVPKFIPHFLSMTATPIPRTLALALYGDLEISIIDELPEARKKIVTKVVSPEKRSEAYEFIKHQVKTGRQIFVICPLIENQNAKIMPKGKNQNENSKSKINQENLFNLDRKSVVEEYEKLSKKIFPELKIGLLHGRLKSKEKEEVMGKFHAGKLDILVSTAVVEVGIDVPNAAVMMVESAERFGLAQLHQFRGRVGRGEHQSYCFLFSESWSETTKKRLEAMTRCSSGFELAEIDLKLRGPGEFVGTRQSGLPDLKMGSLRDIIIVKKARDSAEKIVEKGIENYPLLEEKLKEFENQRHLE